MDVDLILSVLLIDLMLHLNELHRALLCGVVSHMYLLIALLGWGLAI